MALKTREAIHGFQYRKDSIGVYLTTAIWPMQVVVICVCKLHIKSATHEQMREQMSEELPKDVLSGVKLINSNTVVLDPIEYSDVNVLEGSPKSSMKILWKSEDGSCATGVWSCTEGSWLVEWPWDEMCFLLEGELEVTEVDRNSDHLGQTIRINPGDHFHFEKGSKTVWNVIKPVKKIMYIRHNSPIADQVWQENEEFKANYKKIKR